MKKSELLQSLGKDPSQFDLDPTTLKIVPRAPKVQEAPLNAESGPMTAVRSLAGAALPAAGGALSSIGAIAAATPSTPLGQAAVALPAGLAGSYATGKAQHALAGALMPESTQRWNDQETINREANPYWDLGGQIASGLVGNEAGLGRNYSAVRALLAPGNLPKEARAVMQSLALNAGAGGGLSLGMDQANQGLHVPTANDAWRAIANAGGAAAISGAPRTGVAKIANTLAKAGTPAFQGRVGELTANAPFENTLDQFRKSRSGAPIREVAAQEQANSYSPPFNQTLARTKMAMDPAVVEAHGGLETPDSIKAWLGGGRTDRQMAGLEKRMAKLNEGLPLLTEGEKAETQGLINDLAKEISHAASVKQFKDNLLGRKGEPSAEELRIKKLNLDAENAAKAKAAQDAELKFTLKEEAGGPRRLAPEELAVLSEEQQIAQQERVKREEIRRLMAEGDKNKEFELATKKAETDRILAEESKITQEEKAKKDEIKRLLREEDDFNSYRARNQEIENQRILAEELQIATKEKAQKDYERSLVKEEEGFNADKARRDALERDRVLSEEASIQKAAQAKQAQEASLAQEGESVRLSKYSPHFEDTLNVMRSELPTAKGLTSNEAVATWLKGPENKRSEKALETFIKGIEADMPTMTAGELDAAQKKITKARIDMQHAKDVEIFKSFLNPTEDSTSTKALKFQSQDKAALPESPTEGEVKFWDFLTKNKYAAKLGLVPEINANGQRMAGSSDSAKREITLSQRDAGRDTPAHEIIHQLVADVQANGSPAEKKFIEKALASMTEEEFAQGSGRNFVERGDNKKADRAYKDLLDFLKYKLGRSTPAELQRMGGNMLARSRGSAEMGFKNPVEGGVKGQPARADNPVPEKQESIDKQIELTKDPTSSKKATLITEGETKPSNTGLEETQTDKGILLSNPAKMVGKEKLDGRDLGFSQSEKPLTGENVVTTSKDGVKDVLTEVVAPGGEKAAIAAHAKAVPGGESEVKPASEVVEGRKFQPANKDKNEEHYTGTPVVRSATELLIQKGSAAQQKIGHAIRSAIDTSRELSGKFGYEAVEKAKQLSRPEMETVIETLHRREELGREVPTNHLSPRLQQAFDAYKQMYAETGQHRRDIGMLVAGRQGGKDPTGFARIISQDVLKQIRDQPTAPKSMALKKEYIDYNVKRGVSLQKAIESLDALISAGSRKGPSGNNDFAAARLAEGTKPPLSWLEKDLPKAISSYVDRFSRDAAQFEHMGKPDEIAGLLGTRKVKGITSIGANKLVINAMDDLMGAKKPSYGRLGKTLSSAQSVIHAGLVQNPLTRGVDFLTTVVSAPRYLPLAEWPSTYVRTLSGLKEGLAAAKRTGVLRPSETFVDTNINNVGDIFDIVKKGNAGFSRITGSEAIESVARAVAMSAGKHTVDFHAPAALASDKASVMFLEGLDSNWKKLVQTPEGRERLASRVALLFQGKYDASNLPSWARDSAAAPLASMMRWSMEQQNNFMKYAWQPWAKNKDAGPIIRHLLTALGAGVTANEFRSLVSGLKPVNPTQEEINNAPDKKRAAMAEALKVGAILRNAGTLGVSMGMANDAAQAAFGTETWYGISPPTVQAVKSAGDSVIAAVKALNEGRGVVEVMATLADDIASKQVGVYKLLKNKVNPEGAQDRNESRDYNTYKYLSGYKVPKFSPTPDYTNLGDKRFDKAKGPEVVKVAEEEARKIAKNAGGNVEKAVKGLERLQHVGGPRKAPNYKTDEERFAKYINYIAKTQGQVAAKKLALKLIEEQNLKEVKSQLIKDKYLD